MPNLTTTVFPFSITSILGARWLQAQHFYPELIFLDSAHEEDETFLELNLYWDVLKKGGVLFGDDWPWPGVQNDVKKFAKLKNLEVVNAGILWYIKKPLL